MGLKKSILMMATIAALIVSFNVTSIAPTISANAETISTYTTRTTPCRNHIWKYLTAGFDGEVTYYNYQCQVCYAYKYSPWKKL